MSNNDNNFLKSTIMNLTVTQTYSSKKSKSISKSEKIFQYVVSAMFITATIVFIVSIF